MNKTKIKNFSVWARRNLIEVVAYRMRFLGIDENGIKNEMEGSTDSLKLYDMGTSKPAEVSGKDISKRVRLANHIKEHEKSSDYKTAYETIVEEIAYTWFNRLIAIRFMEVNDYLPSGVRVLSSESGKREPDIVTQAVEVAEDQEFALSKDEIWKLKDENKLDELFRILFIQQCKKLHEILPELFDNSLDDYTELLLPISFIDDDAFIRHLVIDIDEADFNLSEQGQVEIIGWLYQYYNSEKKDAVFAAMSNKVKVSKENIAAATQLFTPDWIVRYMVENSLGRLWVDGHADTSAKTDWKYYLEEAEQASEVQGKLDEIRESRKSLTPEQIRFIDPCMGSGHILVYAFDVLMQIYLSCGYTERDAAQNIVRNNLWGLDLDKRAYQLAYFAVMMKARQYDRRFLTREIKPNLAHFQDLPVVNYSLLDETIRSFVQQFENADTYGSLISVETDDRFDEALDNFVPTFEIDSSQIERFGQLYTILSQQYDVVCTNPPYMGIGNANNILKSFIEDKYPDSKSDLCAVFIEKCAELTKRNCYYALITQHAWMFLTSYEKLRKKLQNKTTLNMVHLGARAFEEIGGEVVQTTAFVLMHNKITGYNGQYCRLVEPTTQEGKRKMFLSGDNRFVSKQEMYAILPGATIGYWASDKLLKDFQEGKPLADLATPKQGLATTDNNRFVRLWHEVLFFNIGFNKKSCEEAEDSMLKWFPMIKGGEYNKWYGNRYYLVNYQNDGREIKKNVLEKYTYLKTPDFVVKNSSFYFGECISWAKIAMKNVCFRYFEPGFVFSDAGMAMFAPKEKIKSIFGLMNSKVVFTILQTIAPTTNFEAGHMEKIPVLSQIFDNEEIVKKVNNAIELSKFDWDSFETSWDFKMHPFMKYITHSPEERTVACSSGSAVYCPIEYAYTMWMFECEERFDKLKANEEELNRIFIEIYGLQDELTPEVEDKDVTVRLADIQRDMRSFISYAVGCMFGRYSLDVEGLAYAGGEWDESKFKTFKPDAENCLPITEEYFFEDDIVTQFANFVSAVFGADTLEENLSFIAENIGIKGTGTAREKIRQYFLKEFYKDHCKIYQKRPIYWLFDTGKKNGFKALCYLHRWNVNTVGNVRIDYMHKLQKLYRNELIRLQENIDNGEDIAKNQKRLEKITNQLQETEEYDAKIGMVVAARTEIDLDDGVKVNYDKVQLGSDGKKYQILATI